MLTTGTAAGAAAGPGPAGAPIAIVGLGCRVPGAHGPADFWDMLVQGADAIREIPANRFDAAAGRDPEPAARGPLAALRGGFLDDIDQFDTGFFGISPREAAAMDPQQRLLLECAWEALEDGGVPLERVSGTATGVFVGTDGSNYWELQRDDPDIYGVMGGGARSAAAGRLSFALNARGPSVALDAACASSLVAVNLACQSIRCGESDLAVAAGIHMILAPWESAAFAGAGMLSPTGHCRFGDADADGFVRSEGVGVVVLKALDRALADGDPVRAVIRGCATTNDGTGSGLLMAPAVEGQELMLRRAYADAGIAPSEVDFVEAHGTGTQVGDPVELAALGRVLGAGRAPGRRAWVGTAKSNLGHAEAAAGVIGLIKAVLSLEHRVVPAVLHHDNPNPSVPWDELPVAVPRIPQPLPEDGRLIAGVSAFGISGTNAHVVLSTPDPSPEPGVRRTDAALQESGEAQLLTLSARSADALRDMIRLYIAYLGPGGAGRRHGLRDICYTAAARRTRHGHRVAVVGETHDEIADALRAVLHGGSTSRVSAEPRVAFVFPGQGAQWTGMGRELLRDSPAFRAAIGRCDEVIRAESGWSLIEKLADPETRWEGIDVVQPALWAMGVALADTWRAWGVAPDLVIGHSMGEAAAAYAAGALDLADAGAVICRRSRLMRTIAGESAMLVVELPAAEAAELVEDGDAVSVAVRNSPRSTVLSGAADAIARIKERLDAAEVFCRLVKVDVASHSPFVDPLLTELAAELDTVSPRAGSVPVHSTVTGEPADGASMDAAYWVRNLREPVRFADVVAAVAAEAPTVFLEVSPHPLLAQPIRETAAGAAPELDPRPSLRREQPEREALLSTWAALFEAGAPVDSDRLYPGGRAVPLPPYPWQRERCWLDEAAPPAAAGTPDGPVRTVRTVVVDPAAEPYLTQHRVNGVALAPGTLFLDAVRAAWADAACADSTWADAAGDGPVALSGVAFTEALVPEATGPVHLRVSVERTGAAGGFTVESRPVAAAGPWTTHATGHVRPLDEADALGGAEPLAATLERAAVPWPPADFYRRAAEAGADWGPANQAVRALWSGSGEAVARMELPAGLPARPDAVHPVLFEAGAHPLLAAFEEPGAFVAEAVDEVHLVRGATEAWSRVRVRETTPDGVTVADVTLLGGDHRVVAHLGGLRLRRPPAPVPAPSPAPRASTLPPIGSGGTSDMLEISGELRIRDARQRVLVEVSGTIRVPSEVPAPLAPPSVSAPVAPPVPVRTAPSAPAPLPPAPAGPAATVRAPEPAAAASVQAAGSEPRDLPVVDVAAPDLADPDAVRDQVISEIVSVLRVPPGRVDPSRAPKELGLDSLMAVELKGRLEKRTSRQVTVRQLLDAESIDALALQVASAGAGR